MRYVSVLLLLGVLLPGCKSTNEVTASYDANSNLTTYETRSYTISSISGANFASKKKIDLRAVARCRGQECTPNRAQFIFVASGNQELSLSGIGGDIDADDSQVINWTSEEAGGSEVDVGPGVGGDASISAIGRFASINIQPDQLAQIVTASSVDGSIGGKSFNLNSGVQGALERLLQKMKSNSGGSDSSDISEEQP